MPDQELEQILGLINANVDQSKEVIKQLEQIVQEWLLNRTEQLFAVLYRLDVDEGKVRDVLKTDYAAKAIAGLIFERQLEKWRSRSQHKSEPPSDDLKW